MMRRGMAWRMVIVLSAAGVSCAACAVVIYRLYAAASCPTCGKYQENPRATPAYNEAARWMLETLPRKNRWTHEDTARILAMAKSPAAPPPSGLTEDQRRRLEPYLLRGMARGAIATRMRNGPELTSAQSAAFQGVLLAELDQTEEQNVIGAISLVCYSLLIEVPAVRKKVEAFLSHPDPRISANARRQLDHQDMILELMRQGNWHERRAILVEDKQAVSQEGRCD